jgi:hypothetical protein
MEVILTILSIIAVIVGLSIFISKYANKNEQDEINRIESLDNSEYK